MIRKYGLYNLTIFKYIEIFCNLLQGLKKMLLSLPIVLPFPERHINKMIQYVATSGIFHSFCGIIMSLNASAY